MFTGHFFLSSKLVSSIPSNLNYDFFNSHAHAQDHYFKFVSIVMVFFIHSGCICLWLYKSTLVAPLSLGTFNIWKMHTHSVWWLMSWERQAGVHIPNQPVLAHFLAPSLNSCTVVLLLFSMYIPKAKCASYASDKKILTKHILSSSISLG